jgi:type III secretion system FlhB-like substrate exporter
MSNYQQQIRDIIFQAVEREIPIYEAATVIEIILRKEIDGD